MDDKLRLLIEQHGGYITRKEIISNRYLYYRLLEAVKSGEIIRLKPGVYCMEDAMAETMIDLEKIVPDGVLCLYSAWAHYGLTTQIPQGFYVAIPRKQKITLPDYPPIILNYWDRSIYGVGIVRQQIDGFEIPIYDMEKSVCDAIRYRNKIGIDVSSEILKNYLSRKERNITRLAAYAKSMRIAGILNKYLEIQL
ncbi:MULTISPECIES: type IV toxin-antitoxin system AbiEi family antitoxin domain-containing protein [Bacteroides]|jgi:predicted transcriptional regulator of viral defense system|uniref:type IV toxin-antitoxin system AbiEi family antitoxin domain-containing protein n=1 Tax=Bacteroides TaxID=816 RepID=UPI000698C4F3|nr:type IV toxin-antitoxin system AbiEi family antitoxin domain-containing protein [Bacteroides fragilis]MCE8567430.1 type IV toxin-antitoxin system AbiEi family antitoxin domain-containing protein [Bacteroides fragilis]MCM0196494.1 type IV toxin-antitoxin system AbiEi family antitoxin domain-containing protein [Bacteroides fragilis]MCM0200882.1 type IV toxin-antitoxin system AbiEi family antitoxin domain-containing protein [Bacteroides fragilis]MCM0211485.1 type IV toxin-antitoxin system AbiEi